MRTILVKTKYLFSPRILQIQIKKGFVPRIICIMHKRKEGLKRIIRYIWIQEHGFLVSVHSFNEHLIYPRVNSRENRFQETHGILNEQCLVTKQKNMKYTEERFNHPPPLAKKFAALISIFYYFIYILLVCMYFIHYLLCCCV